MKLLLFGKSEQYSLVSDCYDTKSFTNNEKNKIITKFHQNIKNNKNIFKIMKNYRRVSDSSGR